LHPFQEGRYGGGDGRHRAYLDADAARGELALPGAARCETLLGPQQQLDILVPSQVLDSPHRDEHLVELGVDQRLGRRERPQRARPIGEDETAIASPNDSQDGVVPILTQRIVARAVGIGEHQRRKAAAGISVANPAIVILCREGVVAGKFETPHDALGPAGVTQLGVDGVAQLAGKESGATEQQHRATRHKIRRALAGGRFGDLSPPDGVRLPEQSQNARVHRLALGEDLLGFLGVRRLLKHQLQLAGIEGRRVFRQ